MTIYNMSLALFCCGLMAVIAQEPDISWWAKLVDAIAFGFNAFLAVWMFRRLIGTIAAIKTVEIVIADLVRKMEAASTV